MKKFLIILVMLLISQNIYSESIESYVIIAGGGRSATDARKAKERYMHQSDITRQIKTDIKIIESKNIKGLDPGYYFAVMGFCRDKYKAGLLTNFANKYLKGVYFKKIIFNTKENSPEFIPDKAPFSGSVYKLQTKAFGKFYNDIFNKQIIKADSSKTVIVKQDQVVFTETKGLVEIKYYIGWIRETRQVVYLNQFQFTRLFSDSEEWDPSCKSDERTVEYGPGFNASESSEVCDYRNGIRSYSNNGYEWSSLTVHFPADKYSFEEIFNYYAGSGQFSELFRNDIVLNKENKSKVGNECCFIFIPGKQIGSYCNHKQKSLEKRGEEIIFTNCGGT
ncbi:MAG: hypothetical protein JXK07_15240 [Spirochaetes bacterium]|nr:hypothetical protein [Spirochaetota bacterium]MBN2769378.1 hypothetical protein [Spirochaetota bacterium]